MDANVTFLKAFGGEIDQALAAEKAAKVSPQPTAPPAPSSSPPPAATPPIAPNATPAAPARPAEVPAPSATPTATPSASPGQSTAPAEVTAAPPESVSPSTEKPTTSVESQTEEKLIAAFKWLKHDKEKAPYLQSAVSAIMEPNGKYTLTVLLGQLRNMVGIPEGEVNDLMNTLSTQEFYGNLDDMSFSKTFATEKELESATTILSNSISGPRMMSTIREQAKKHS